MFEVFSRLDSTEDWAKVASHPSVRDAQVDVKRKQRADPTREYVILAKGQQPDRRGLPIGVATMQV